MAHIRYGMSEDKDAYLRLQLGAFPDESRERHDRYFDQRVAHNEVLVMDDAGTVIAHLTFRRSISTPFPDAIHVDELVVDPVHRRRGHASALMQRAIGEARDGGYRYLYLETSDDPKNHALDLYTALGFHKVGAFYGEPEQGIYRLDL